MLESGWVDESRQNQVCNLPDMSHHRYNNLLWSDLVNACGFMSSEHLQGRYWIWVIFILAMFQVLWHRLRKPELVPLARKVNSWNCYGIFCIFNMVVVHEQVCWGIALMGVNVDIACSVRIIKQNAMQSFLCRLWESALSSVNECELSCQTIQVTSI